MKKLVLQGLVLGTAMCAVASVHAQTERALERRADRLQRRAERRFERANFFTQQAWQQLNPWIESNRATADWAYRRALRAADNAVDAQRRAAANELASDRVDALRGNADVDLQANANGQAWYGFRDNTDARWFYDYYSVVPSYSPNAYYLSSRSSAKADADAKADKHMRVVTGEVTALKKSLVGGEEHLVAKIDQKTSKDPVDAVDLGLVEKASDLDLRVGSEVKVRGWTEPIGDKELLVAQSVTVGDRQMSIQRDFTRAIKGKVIDVKTFEINDRPTYIAIVESGDDRMVVDLGASNHYETRIEPKSEVQIVGTPVRTNGQVLLMANEVRLNGGTIKLR